MRSTANFEFLKDHDPLLLQLATTAESAFVPDPNTTLLKLRQLGEAMAQDIASRLGVEADERGEHCSGGGLDSNHCHQWHWYRFHMVKIAQVFAFLARISTCWNTQIISRQQGLPVA